MKNGIGENRNDITMIPRVVFEAEMARWERNFKRIVIVLVMLILLLVGTNVGWLIYESQFDETVWTQEVEQSADGSGNNHFVGGDYYGNETKGNDNG